MVRRRDLGDSQHLGHHRAPRLPNLGGKGRPAADHLPIYEDLHCLAPTTRRPPNHRGAYLDVAGKHPGLVPPQADQAGLGHQQVPDWTGIPGSQYRLRLDEYHPAIVGQKVEPGDQEQPRHVGVGADQARVPRPEGFPVGGRYRRRRPELSEERRVPDHGFEPRSRTVWPDGTPGTERITDHHPGHLGRFDSGPRGQKPSAGLHRRRINVGPE